MRVLIIEDEHFAAKRLEKLIHSQMPNAQILDIIDTVKESVTWFSSHNEPDLIFMDIQLADGLSFQIFDEINITCPIIFTTAFDEYALNAFKVNSVDYLLKPIEEKLFIQAIEKYKNLYQNKVVEIDWKSLTQDISEHEKQYKQRFLIKSGSAFTYLNVADIQIIYSEDGLSFAINTSNKKVLIDKTLDGIFNSLDPKTFFRVNRKYIITLDSVSKIHTYFNHRLKLDLHNKVQEEVIVSRDKVKAFKAWIDC